MTDTEFKTFVERAETAPPEFKTIFNDFWRDTEAHYDFFADLQNTNYEQMDKIVFSIQRFLNETEENVKSNKKDLMDTLALSAALQKEERAALIDAHAFVEDWYANNDETLTHLKLLVGAYILFASGIDLKKNQYHQPREKPFLSIAEMRKRSTERMQDVLLSIAEKRSWPWRTQAETSSPQVLYEMLPNGDNEEQIDQIVASSKPEGIRLPPSVAPTAAAPSPAEPRPLYRDLSAAPSPPVMGSKPSLVAPPAAAPVRPPAAALSPLRMGSKPSSPAQSAYSSPLLESIRSSTRGTPLMDRNPRDVLDEISKFLKCALALRKHCKRNTGFYQI